MRLESARPSTILLGSSRFRLDLVEHFLVVGEAADVVLVPDLLAVYVNVEHAARTFDQLGIHVELLLDRCRQTGGLGEIVSLRAVFDGDRHGILL